MSDAPRTNAIAHRGYDASIYIAEMTDLARTIERELAIVTKERDELKWKIDEVSAAVRSDISFGAVVEALFYGPLRIAEAERDALRAKVAELQADKERMDWLESEESMHFLVNGPANFRSAIDAARKEKP